MKHYGVPVFSLVPLYLKTGMRQCSYRMAAEK